MIEEIKGSVSLTDEKSIVVMVGGVGLRVWTTLKTAAKTNLGDRISLFTDVILRETEISLYGFEDPSEREMFRTLVKVNGIGPKAAMAVLSTMTVEMIYQAVRTKDHRLFTQVPGIGGKTAQKLMLYLQDSLDIKNAGIIDESTATVNSDLLDALVGLGYSVVEAQTCIQKIPDDAPEDLESRLRIALQQFS